MPQLQQANHNTTTESSQGLPLDLLLFRIPARLHCANIPNHTSECPHRHSRVHHVLSGLIIAIRLNLASANKG